MTRDESLERLALFESRDVVTEQCKLVTGRTPNAAHAREIACHVMQGRQYLEAARSAGDLIRPLLVYYAALSLARAVVMFRLGRRESALTASHGLGAVAWGDALAREGLDAVPALRIEVTRGTFAELAAATANTETVTFFIGPYPSTTRVTRSGTSDVASGTAFTLGEVWSRIPDLQHTLAVAITRHFDCWPVFGFYMADNFLDVEVYRLGDDMPAGDRMGNLLGDFPRSEPNVDFAAWGPLASNYARFIPEARGLTGRVRFACADRATLARLAERFTHDAQGVLHLRRPLAGNVLLSPLSLLVIASYAAGMLVRYHATRWQDLMRHEKGDRALTILRKSVALADERLPTLVVEALMAKMPDRTPEPSGEPPPPNNEVL